MSFYIAERNKETGKFELWMEDGDPLEISSESDAIDKYTMVMKLQGQKNVRLFEEVILDVDLKVTRWQRGVIA